MISGIMWLTWHLLRFCWEQTPLRALYNKHSFWDLAQDSSHGLHCRGKELCVIVAKCSKHQIHDTAWNLDCPSAKRLMAASQRATNGDTYLVTHLCVLCWRKKLDCGVFLKTLPSWNQPNLIWDWFTWQCCCCQHPYWQREFPLSQ